MKSLSFLNNVVVLVHFISLCDDESTQAVCSLSGTFFGSFCSFCPLTDYLTFQHRSQALERVIQTVCEISCGKGIAVDSTMITAHFTLIESRK